MTRVAHVHYTLCYFLNAHIYSTNTARQYDELKEPKSSFDPHTNKNPIAGLLIQALHLALVFMALVRQLLGTSAITLSISLMALLETPGHCVAFLIRLRAEGHVLLIMLIDLI